MRVYWSHLVQIWSSSNCVIWITMCLNAPVRLALLMKTELSVWAASSWAAHHTAGTMCLTVFHTDRGHFYSFSVLNMLRTVRRWCYYVFISNPHTTKPQTQFPLLKKLWLFYTKTTDPVCKRQTPDSSAHCASAWMCYCPNTRGGCSIMRLTMWFTQSLQKCQNVGVSL